MGSSANAGDYLLPLLLVAYMLFGRPFAWLHIPGTPIFIGEMVLATAVLRAVRALTWAPLWRLSNVPFVMALYVGWNFTRFLPGFFGDPINALRDSAVWIYAIVTWAIIALLAVKPTNLVRWFRGYLRLIPVAVIWLPLTVYLFTIDIGTIPDSTVGITDFDTGIGQIHLVMFVAFLWLVWSPKTRDDLRWRTIVSVLALIGLLVMGTRNRGGFVGGSVGLSMLMFYARSRSQLILRVGRGLLVLAIVIVMLDPQVDIGDREISVSQLADNVTSVVTLEGEGALESNIHWRLGHWANILDGVSREVPLGGHGFGPNVAEIYHIPQTDLGLRNAHNSHLTIFARSGWTGLMLWIMLWGFWFVEVNRARRRLSESNLASLGGLAAWAMIGVVGLHIEAVFNPSLEGPQASFWLWSLAAVGVFLSVVSQDRRRSTPDDLEVIDASLGAMSRHPRRALDASGQAVDLWPFSGRSSP